MFKILKRFIKEEDGATAVEFALVAMPFLLMLFGVMEAGRIGWTLNGVQYAVEETSRYAALNPTFTNAQYTTYAEDKISDMMIASEALEITSSNTMSSGVDFIEITGSYEYSTMMGSLLPGDFGVLDFSSVARKPIID